MTNGEFIKMLQEFPEDLPIEFYCQDSDMAGPTNTITLIDENYKLENACEQLWITFELPKGEHFSRDN